MWSTLRRSRPWLLAVSALVMSIQAAPPAFAWGKVGHEVAGAVADCRLTPAARAAVAELLAGDASLTERTLSGISGWADGPGLAARRESGPWHFVNVPLAAPSCRPEHYDEARGCVITKIGDFRRVLSDPSAPPARRREALLYFVHFVQDIHQPLHVGDDRDGGGNRLQVRFVGRDSGTNLHKVWDAELIQYAGLDEAAWVCRLNALADAPENRGWAGGTPVDWANESLALAREAYHLQPLGRKIASGDRLDGDYARSSLLVVQRRLAQAGVRLAHELNDIFRVNRAKTSCGR